MSQLMSGENAAASEARPNSSEIELIGEAPPVGSPTKPAMNAPKVMPRR